MIKKNYILLFVVLLTQVVFAQKPQKVGYIDSEYILENVPAYTSAQSKLDAKISRWTSNLNKLKSEIDGLRLKLSNEKAILTEDLVAEREEDILIKVTALAKRQDKYFGTSGDLFMLRKQLVKPIQDQIFNATQEIVKAKKYDLIFDKAGNDVVMIYANPKYDISELVLRKIVKGRKKKENEKKKSDKELEKEKRAEAKKTKTEALKSKKEKLQEKIKKQKEANAAKRAAAIKANKEKRAKRIADAKAKKEGLKNISEPKKEEVQKEEKEVDTNEIEESEEEVIESKDTPKTKKEIAAEKRKKLMERLARNKTKKDSLRKASAEKREKKKKAIKDKLNKIKENINN